jgi:hypothetical protein
LIAEGILDKQNVLTRVQAIVTRDEANTLSHGRGSGGEQSPTRRGRFTDHFTRPQIQAFSQALLDAFATPSELESLARLCFGRSLSDLVPDALPMDLIVYKLLGEAESRRQLGDLLSAAIELRPENSRLQFLASQLETRQQRVGELDPESLMTGVVPFLGRSVLHEFLARVQDPSSVPVLLITGPPGSGKSYSLNLIRRVAQQTGRFTIAGVSAKEVPGPVELVKRLALEARWNADTIPRPGKVSSYKFNLILAHWMVSQAARRRKPILFFIDDLESAEIIEFVERLGSSISASTISSLRLVLTSSAPISFSPEVRVQKEKLEALTLSDAMIYLKSLGTDAKTLQDAYQHLEQEYQIVERSSEPRERANFLVHSMEKLAEKFRSL